MEARSQLRHRPTVGLPLVYTTPRFEAEWHSRATANRDKASAQSMDRRVRRRLPHDTGLLPRARTILASSVFLLLVFSPYAPTAFSQAGSPSPPPQAQQASPAAANSSADENLHAALQQAAAALNHVQMDRWKMSRAWKSQLQSDANSVQQDLATQLPGLFQAVQAAPGALEPRLKLMHNVNALYDVMVRITTASGIAGGKADAANLANALENLESARRNVAAQLQQAAAEQDRRLTELQRRMQNAASNQPAAADHMKTIIVDNRISHHATKRHRKPPAKTTPPAHQTENPEPHTTTP